MEFRILGPLEVVLEDRALPLGGAKQRALLAILLTQANRVVSIDRLIDELWGEEPPATATNILQVYVSQLRKVLHSGRSREADDQVLITQRPGYLIRTGPDELDLAWFERLSEEGRQALGSGEPAVASVKLRSALALWRGQALVDFTFEPFAQTEIERLEGLRIAALEERIEADLALGRHVELVSELDTLVRDHPLRERPRGQLMLALYRSGRQAEALQVYQETMRVLGDELGIDPTPTLQRLHESILRQDPSLEPPPPLPAPSESRPTVVAPGTIEQPPEPPEAAVPPGPRTEPQEPVAVGQVDLEDQFLPVTVLFADIVGSTSLGERLSADEVRAVIGECVSRMSRAVEDLGGTVQAYMGDGICAYFGVPRSHEDDPERAGRAALRILQVVAEFSREIASAWGIPDLSVRIGVNSGRTVVGVVGAAAPQQVAFGDPTNVAARLQTSAEPGTIAIGSALASRLGSGFAMEPLGELRVKGRAEAVEAWRLLGRSALPATPAATPLVGRERELALLESVAQALEVGRGQILLVHGEAGIGKTRMVSELRSLVDEGIPWLEGRCRSYGGEVPYAPFVDAFRMWLGVGDAEPEVSVRTKLRARLEASLGSRSEELLPYFGRMLSVRIDPAMEESLNQMSGGELGARIRGAYRAWIEGVAERSPLVLVVEDLHFADPLTVQLAEALLPVVDSSALLIVATSRPEPSSSGWRFWLRVQTDFLHRTVEMQLGRLPDEEGGELIDTLAPTGTLEPATRKEILARGEGNPLYLEELLRTLTESAGFERDHSGSLSFSRAAVVLPPALENLLVVRIQGLPAGARRVAQIAAVIGREFPIGIVERVADPDDVREDVSVLLRSDVIQELRRFPELECTFRHGLLRDAAFSTLTPARAKELFRQVAASYEERHADSLDEHLERLAFYYNGSDDPEKALEYLERAGARAAGINGLDQAERMWNRALKLARRLGDREAEDRMDRLLSALPGDGT